MIAVAYPTMRPSEAGELVGSELEREVLYPNVVPPVDIFGAYGFGEGQFSDTRGVAMSVDDHVYVSECGSSRVQVFDASHRAIRVIGRAGSAVGEFVCPAGLALHGDHLYVVDSGNERIQVFRGDRAVKAWGAHGSGVGQFLGPRGIAVGPAGVYVADTGNHRVQVFDLNGKHRLSIGKYGAAPGELNSPRGVALDAAGNIYVADTLNARIQKFAPDGTLLAAFGEYGTYPGQLSSPTALAVNGDRVFVADLVNHRVQVFDTSGAFQYQWGRHPTSPRDRGGRMHYPTHLTVSPSGAWTVVCEPFESRCQVFDNEEVRRQYKPVNESAWWEKYPWFHYRTHAAVMYPSAQMMEDPHPLLLMSEEDIHRIVVMKVVEGKPQALMQFGSFGSEPGQFKSPQGVFADQAGNIYVSDTLNNRVQVFNLKGEFQRQFGKMGTGPGEFNEVGAGSADAEGNVYFPDSMNHRIQVFDKDGTFLRQWGKQGKNDGEFQKPIDAQVDVARKQVYVVDLYNHRVQVFDLQGRFLRKLGGFGTDRAEFILPMAVGIDPVDGSVVVSDETLNRLQKFDAEGQFVGMWGRYGVGPGEFYTPVGVAIDKEQRAYVVDYGNHRGQILDKDGKHLGIFGERVIEFREDRDKLSTRLDALAKENEKLRGELATASAKSSEPAKPKGCSCSVGAR